MLLTSSVTARCSQKIRCSRGFWRCFNTLVWNTSASLPVEGISPNGISPAEIGKETSRMNKRSCQVQCSIRLSMVPYLELSCIVVVVPFHLVMWTLRKTLPDTWGLPGAQRSDRGAGFQWSCACDCRMLFWRTVIVVSFDVVISLPNVPN